MHRIAAVGICALASGFATAQGAGETLDLQLPGVSHHFGAPKQVGKAWNELHDGLGIQSTRVRNDYVRRYTAGFMRDSFGKQGLYAGVSFGLRLIDGDVTMDVAAAPMLLYRTTRFDSSDRKAIVVALPTVSVQHKASGIGANLTVLPAGNFGKDLKFPGLIYLQFTYRLR